MKKASVVYVLSIFMLITCIGIGASFAGNIDPANDGSRYAYGENVGWLNFKPALGTGVTVTDTEVSGYAWQENIGWINLSHAQGGVVNDGIGNLSGYAWGENVGWINFAPTNGGVFINACGEFNGSAWGENVGWISFSSDGDNPFGVVTSWVSPIDGVAPVTSPTTPLQDWYNTNLNFEISATDCGGGISTLMYQINGGSVVSVSDPSAIIDFNTDGVYTLSFYSVDQAGNTEEVNEVTIQVDKTPPDITITTPVNGNTYNINSDVIADFTVTDALSGVVTVTSTVADGALINTSAAGAQAFTVDAFDAASNSNSLTHSYTIVYPGNIDTDSQGYHYAYGENVGWFNFKPSYGPGVTVADTTVTGFVWQENIGWINLSPTLGGVVNDGTGNLSGYAWSENVGWINFDPNNGGVSIDSNGDFDGWAWGENIGWIHFQNSAVPYIVKTSWPDGGGCTLTCDLDGDCDADMFDYQVFRSSLGSCTGDTNFIQEADYDTDGCISYADFRIWYGCYRTQ
ncbi:MAG: hypothetical protein GY775_11820 [Candidatus Scalindua sp.]|nr:hypothetical protein [Candidatus Scalindua sp.]